MIIFIFIVRLKIDLIHRILGCLLYECPSMGKYAYIRPPKHVSKNWYQFLEVALAGKWEYSSNVIFDISVSA